jgi:hypothetical protein
MKKITIFFMGTLVKGGYCFFATKGLLAIIMYVVDYCVVRPVTNSCIIFFFYYFLLLLDTTFV